MNINQAYYKMYNHKLIYHIYNKFDTGIARLFYGFRRNVIF